MLEPLRESVGVAAALIDGALDDTAGAVSGGTGDACISFSSARGDRHLSRTSEAARCESPDDTSLSSAHGERHRSRTSEPRCKSPEDTFGEWLCPRCGKDFELTVAVFTIEGFGCACTSFSSARADLHLSRTSEALRCGFSEGTFGG